MLNMFRYDFLIFKVSQEEIICLVKSTDSCWYMAKPIQYCKVKKKSTYLKGKSDFVKLYILVFRAKIILTEKLSEHCLRPHSPPPHHKQNHTCTHTHTRVRTHTHTHTYIHSLTHQCDQCDQTVENEEQAHSHTSQSQIRRIKISH